MTWGSIYKTTRNNMTLRYTLLGKATKLSTSLPPSMVPVSAIFLNWLTLVNHKTWMGYILTEREIINITTTSSQSHVHNYTYIKFPISAFCCTQKLAKQKVPNERSKASLHVHVNKMCLDYVQSFKIGYS